MSVVHLSQKNFESEVLKSITPVMVDFWAEWCAPCKMISPIVEEIAQELNGKLKVTKLNVDQAQELAARYHVMSIPTLMIFKSGKVVELIVGAMPKEQLLEKIRPHISA